MKNLIAIINNAILLKKKQVVVPFSKKNLAFIQYLFENNFIFSYTINKKIITVDFYFKGNQPPFKKIQFIGKKGQRVFINNKKIMYMNNNELNLYIVQTITGIFKSSTSKNLKQGGELICKIEF